jgi:hypothetical protein
MLEPRHDVNAKVDIEIHYHLFRHQMLTWLTKNGLTNFGKVAQTRVFPRHATAIKREGSLIFLSLLSIKKKFLDLPVGSSVEVCV